MYTLLSPNKIISFTQFIILNWRLIKKRNYVVTFISFLHTNTTKNIFVYVLRLLCIIGYYFQSAEQSDNYFCSNKIERKISKVNKLQLNTIYNIIQRSLNWSTLNWAHLWCHFRHTALNISKIKNTFSRFSNFKQSSFI